MDRCLDESRIDAGTHGQMLQLLTVFVLLSLSELVLLIMFLNLHWGLTLFWVLMSGLAGVWFIRRQGNNVMAEMRRAVAEDRLPADVMIEAFLVLLAGSLLIAPGIITDVIGVSILVKPFRRHYRRYFVDWLKRRFRITSIRFGDSREIVEGEVVGTGKETRANGKAPEFIDPSDDVQVLPQQESSRWQ